MAELVLNEQYIVIRSFIDQDRIEYKVGEILIPKHFSMTHNMYVFKTKRFQSWLIDNEYLKNIRRFKPFKTNLEKEIDDLETMGYRY